MPVNLHNIVRGAITAIHDDESVHWYMFSGQINTDGAITPLYHPPVIIRAQVQSESDDALYHSNNVGENEVIRRFYMYAPGVVLRPAGIIRPLGRAGDLIYRPVEATWWLITATIDDFSASGWVCVRAVQQVEADDFVPEVIQP